MKKLNAPIFPFTTFSCHLVVKDLVVKGLVAELAPPHVQSAWGPRGERIRVAGLAACFNYFSKKCCHLVLCYDPRADSSITTALNQNRLHHFKLSLRLIKG